MQGVLSSSHSFYSPAVAVSLPIPSGVFFPVFVLGAAIVVDSSGKPMATAFPDGVNGSMVSPGGYAVVGKITSTYTGDYKGKCGKYPIFVCCFTSSILRLKWQIWYIVYYCCFTSNILRFYYNFCCFTGSIYWSFVLFY